MQYAYAIASRFVEADEEFIDELRNTSDNKNSKRSTDYWTNIFQQWAKTRRKNEQLESYEVPELNEALENFALYVINIKIASALGQLRINFTCIFKVFQIALVASRLGEFSENFENTREINPYLPSGPCD